MKYELSGFSVPIGGISWNKNMTGKDFFKNLFLFLESKRILVNPVEMEKKEWCIESVLEIKQNLLPVTGSLSLSEFDLKIIRNMIDACNTYLDAVSPLKLPMIIYKNHNEWEDVSFDKAMKEFRNTFRDDIKSVEKQYKLCFAKEIPDSF